MDSVAVLRALDDLLVMDYEASANGRYRIAIAEAIASLQAQDGAVATVAHTEYSASRGAWRHTLWTAKEIPCGTKLYTHPAALSTPAASTGDVLLDRLDREARAWESWNADYSDRPNECCVTSPPLLREAAATIRQLQARNAEQAAAIREFVGEAGCFDPASVTDREAFDIAHKWITGYHDNKNRLTALLEGIEGLEAKWDEQAKYWASLQTTYGGCAALTLDDCADDLKTLRESSVPAIGDTKDDIE